MSSFASVLSCGCCLMLSCFLKSNFEDDDDALVVVPCVAYYFFVVVLSLFVNNDAVCCIMLLGNEWFCAIPLLSGFPPFPCNNDAELALVYRDFFAATLKRLPDGLEKVALQERFEKAGLLDVIHVHNKVCGVLVSRVMH